MSSGGDDGSPPSLSGFRYGIGVSAMVLTLIITITLLSYFCTRTPTPSSSSTPTRPPPPPSSVAVTVSHEDHPRIISGDHSRGLNDAALRNFPKLLYSQAKLHRHDQDHSNNDNDNNNNCSICLCEYVDTDMIRLLPECGHVFHLGCVDSWLRQSATCPICRSSPIPSPLSGPRID